ncbi:MAG TPA: hypothetical protein ENJ35_08880 [Gammaproteobacteria bacterium]|nr:hypothetical protein [Gammaproteobacteria bacterium]
MISYFFRFSLVGSFFLLLTACGGGGNGSDPVPPNLISCSNFETVAGQLATVSCQAVTAGTALTSNWSVQGADGTGVTITNNGLTATFTPPSVQDYSVTVVAQAGNDSETEKFVVKATNPAPTVQCPSSLAAKAARNLTVDCSSSDFAGEKLTYLWTITPPAGVSVTGVQLDTEDLTFTPPAAGAYLLALKASNTNLSTTITVQLNVGPAGSWKIIPVGDSITQSNFEHQSYRYQLWKKMVQQNIDFDLIGSQHTNSNQTATGTLPAGTVQVPQPAVTFNGQTIPFDPDHEGYWGATADEVLVFLKDALPALDEPDIALVHLGTNDVRDGQDNASTIADLKAVITALRGKNPRVIIMLAKIIPTDTAAVEPLNTLIGGLSTMSTVNSPVIIVDQYTGFDRIPDTFDGIHPNLSGENKLADKWLAEINKVIK